MPKQDLSRNPQHCYFSLTFFAVLDSANKYLKQCTVQNRSKNRQNCGICNRICAIQEQFVKSTHKYQDMCKVELSCCGIRNCKRNPQTVSRIRKLRVGSANCKWNPHFFCGVRLHISFHYCYQLENHFFKSQFLSNTQIRSQILTNIPNFDLSC